MTRLEVIDNGRNNLISFVNKLKSLDIHFENKDFTQIDLQEFTPDDFIYCNPPYFIATGTYNDGNRGFRDWKEQQEFEL